MVGSRRLYHQQIKIDCSGNHVVTAPETLLDFGLARARRGGRSSEPMRSLFSAHSDRNHVSVSPPSNGREKKSFAQSGCVNHSPGKGVAKSQNLQGHVAQLGRDRQMASLD